ncbi:ARM repeat-containing protein [Mollisia scopiformis]|uniref:ARM repeat-containing protein n=1 Tax=Mollisia scopiformis TaxID=149040 RepID=A0A194XS14_MOLSC|nr:ARM repeat-containing protein [Mollisia scopiformis]KUJ22517.1 ARM repeat-containing protein [Mollisia scopiformis]
MSTEARELELCGKVEMRIALAKDDKLEALLKTYLPPLLLKMASEFPAVRNKVVEICQHVKIRLAGNKDIILPVAALLKQYKENPQYSMIRHFDLMFIQQSIGKLTSSEQMNLIPTILHGLEKDAGKTTCATIFNLFLRLLPRLRLPLRGSKEDNELRQQLGLDEHSEDAKFAASWFAKLMLLVVVRSTATGVSCPGLTVQEYEFLTLSGKQTTWDPSSDEGLNLTQTKILVLAFLTSGAFTDEERFLPALFASGDANTRISGAGEDLLKRSTVSLEDADAISNLLQIYFTLKPPLQTRVLVLLTKSAVSTTFPSQVVRIVQEALSPHDNTNLPAPGLETIKFRNSLFNYMNWVSRIASKSDLAHVAPQLVGFLRRYIEDQGWPVPHERSLDAASLRALAYETLGSLAKTAPSIVVEKDLSIVRWLLRSLTEEGSSESIFVSIEGALASLLGAFAPPLDPILNKELQLLLLQYMTLQEGGNIVRSARFATVRWANRCLEYKDVVARWIDVLALAGRTDERSDVVEEGKKGLDPYWYRLLNSTPAASTCSFPKWDEMVKVFFTSQSILENSSIANSMKSGMDVDEVSVFGNFAGSKINAFPSAVNYCRQILLLTALEESETPLAIDADWERQLDVLYRSDKTSRKIMRNHVHSVDEAALNIYLGAAFEGMLRNDGNGLGDCGKCFVEIASIAPAVVISKLAGRALELLPSIRSNNTATRLLAAEAFGILAPHPVNTAESVKDMLTTLLKDAKPWESAVGAEANRVHGSILALGFILSRSSYYGRLESMQDSVVGEAISMILAILSAAKDASTNEAAFSAISQVSMSGVLTISRISESSLSATEIITMLTTEAKKSNEKAIAALGRFSLIFEEVSDSEPATDDLLATILSKLYDLFGIKQAETHFTIGEAFSCLAACWDSDVLPLSLDVDTTYSGRMKRHKTLEHLLKKLLRDCKTPKPSLKKASGIWLFSLIQYCGHLPEIQICLRECQAAFMGLLSARDELVQETASRGLSLVYEQGDSDLRDKLVKDLVASFTGSSTQLKVDEDTELFEPGALPTGEGESVTSYKDIISLANEVGDQTLVYKFMSLASNAATWSTRAAFGRFGLSNILSESEVDPKLYPKLYRYRFDPNANVQRSMNDIWHALVKDESVTINLHFDDILDDLLKSILAKEWRTRQASCAAIADLVQGREFDKYESRLHDIWQVAFKVMDDIKGSVRAEALKLSMALTGILVRQVEAGSSSKHAQAMLKEVLPFLLSEQGLESSAKDVRIFAALTVLRLVKSGGKALLPFVPDLVEQLLGLLSTLGEEEGVDYLYLRAKEYNLTEEKIDNLRSRAVSQSPLMEAIERCLDILDGPAMSSLVPRLENAVKTTIGMPSKMGCAGVLASLATRHSLVFKPHADIFLKITEKAVLDRNNAVSAAYARSAGYLSRLASDSAILRLAAYTKDLYFNAENETRRQVAGEIVYAVSKFATDRFNALASDFLPFVFFAKHDFDEHVKKQFENTWDENVGGSRAVLLYSREINSLSVGHLESPKWTVKHTAALTIADVVTSSGAEISSTDAAAMWPALEKALALKTFDGKEKVLSSFVSFTKAASSFWSKESSIAPQMKKIAIREAKRNNDTYRPFAFTSLGEFCEARTDLDMFEDVYNVIGPCLEDFTSEDKMDTEDDTKVGGKSHESATITAGIGALFRAINIKNIDPSPLTHIPTLLKVVKKVVVSTKITVATSLTIYERAKALFDGLRKRTHTQGTKHYDLLLDYFKVLDIQSGAGTEAMRLKRAEAAEMMVQALVGGVFGMFREGREECKEQMKQMTQEGRKNERSPGVQAVLDRVLKGLVE